MAGRYAAMVAAAVASEEAASSAEMLVSHSPQLQMSLPKQQQMQASLLAWLHNRPLRLRLLLPAGKQLILRGSW